MTPQAHVDQHRHLVEQVFEDVLNGHDLEAIPDYYTADCEFYGMTGPDAIDREAYTEFLAMYFEAFPDLSFELEEVLAEDDTVAVRWTATGTHEGDLMDISATGETATVTGMSFIHVADGRAVEVYDNMDMLGLLQQLGAIPDSPRKIVRLMVGQLKSRLTDR